MARCGDCYRFHGSLENLLDAIQAHMSQRDKVIQAMAKRAVQEYSLCPSDELKSNCPDFRNKLRCIKCWIEYFTKQVEAENG